MEIKGIRYVGPVLDGSGYARANRGNILALHAAGIPITVHPISFEATKPDLGETGKLLDSLVDKSIDYNINIIHTTPEFWERYRVDEEGVINVGYTIWETSKLHKEWPKYINNTVDKVIVGCEWNKKVFEESGVTIPIGVIPHGIRKTEYDDVEHYAVSGIPDDAYVFYSIFQFTERKHPIALLKSYYYAFQDKPDANVVLVLKTYRSDYSESERKAIRETINRLKKVMPLDHYPKVVLISDMLTEDEMASLHQRGDCYISVDRGEGFGLSGAAAGAAGHPIIVTGYGGVKEYAKPDNSYLVRYTLTPVSGMPWSPWYCGDQLWAEPDVVHAAELMNHVYANQDEAKAKGAKLKEFIQNNLSWENIADMFIKELTDIDA